MGSLTSSKFVYKPSYRQRGTSLVTEMGSAADKLDTRLGHEIWITDPLYGAVATADGTTPDNAPIIQAVINECLATGKTMVVPAGVYLINSGLSVAPTDTAKVLNIRGVGSAYSAGHLGSGSATGVIALRGTSSDPVITIDGGAATNRYPLSRSVWSDVTFSYASAANSRIAVDFLTNPSYCLFRNVNVYGNGNAAAIGWRIAGRPNGDVAGAGQACYYNTWFGGFVNNWGLYGFQFGTTADDCNCNANRIFGATILGATDCTCHIVVSGSVNVIGSHFGAGLKAGGFHYVGAHGTSQLYDCEFDGSARNILSFNDSDNAPGVQVVLNNNWSHDLSDPHDTTKNFILEYDNDSFDNHFTLADGSFDKASADVAGKKLNRTRNVLSNREFITRNFAVPYTLTTGASIEAIFGGSAGIKLMAGTRNLAVDGCAANVGSLYANTINGKLYAKTGAGNTNWTLVGSQT